MYESSTQLASLFPKDNQIGSIDPLDLARPSSSLAANAITTSAEVPSFLKPSQLFNNTSYPGTEMQRITSMPNFKSSNNFGPISSEPPTTLPYGGSGAGSTIRDITTTTLYSSDTMNPSVKIESYPSHSQYQSNLSQGPPSHNTLSQSFPHLAGDMARSLSAPNTAAQYQNPYGAFGNDFINGVTEDSSILNSDYYPNNSNSMSWDINYGNSGSNYSQSKTQFGLPVMSNEQVYPSGMVDNQMDFSSSFDISNGFQMGQGPIRRKTFNKSKMDMNGMDSIFPSSEAFVAQEAVHGTNEPSNLLVNNVSAHLQGPADAMEPPMSTGPPPSDPNDPEATPKRQNVRYNGDMYTPQWVRYSGHLKEGYCDLCEPGKWLQLKNSAFWYHKQFYHGISSTSGKFFCAPVRTRTRDNETVEGLCHQCHQWIQVSSTKRRNSVLWFRHAHKCHVYHKPKNTFPRRR